MITTAKKEINRERAREKARRSQGERKTESGMKRKGEKTRERQR